MQLRWLLIFGLVLAGCGGQPPDAPRTKPSARAAATEKRLQEGPAARTYPVRGGELLVIEVPVKDSTGLVEMQRCYVFRDLEFRTSTLSCAREPEVLLAN